MYAFCAILLVIIMVETICLMVGKDTAKKWFAGCLEELTGACEADLGRGLCYAEAIDFGKCLKEFFQNATLSDYKIDAKGWICVSYAVGNWKVQDKEAVRKAIRIELHSYLLSNHGVDSWTYYVPVLTEDLLLLKIATSRVAEKEFLKLDFHENTRKEIPMEEEK